VPYGVDVRFGIPERPSREGLLRVLTVGAVGLQKGAPDVLTAARQTKEVATFRMVGQVRVAPSAERDLRSHLELRGAVPRSDIGEHFAWADVFLLPSICEGSATVTYEALASGLPVICTRNTGSVVRDGVDGFIVPIRSPEAIAKRLEQLASDRQLLRQLSLNARQRSAEFTLERYGERLLGASAHTAGHRDQQ
jgi:glycosyltransferase involved in cell wall biosynthesis